MGINVGDCVSGFGGIRGEEELPYGVFFECFFDVGVEFSECVQEEGLVYYITAPVCNSQIKPEP